MRYLICLIILSIAPLANAQAPVEPAKPGKPHALFARDAGIWDCQVKMYHKGPKAPPTISKGVESVELVSDGLYARSTFTFNDRGRRFEGHSLVGYDPRSKEYVGVWVDNYTTIPSQTRGVYDETKKTLTVHSTAVDGEGNELQTRQVTRYIDDFTKTLEIALIVEVNKRKIRIKLTEVIAKKRQE